MNRILIVEDEVRIIAPVERGLRSHGFITAVAKDGREAISLARDADFDLLILDIGLPNVDGWVVLRELRERGEQMPIVILSARDDIRDKVAGLEGGANDYMTKPFSFQELLARIRLRLRETRVSQTKEEKILKAGNISLNLHTHQVYVGDRLVELAAREFSLLETLMQQPGRVISRDRLLKEVWGYDYDPGSNIVDVYIGYLRKKLGNYSIETVRGVGYCLPS
ncbi:MAG: response regulator transcription factor [Cyanosarcina radialis HA8281-LM2]|jgi:DNA-binding response OmpR family regulator|nr:response regulator transcription factor [Cyanosarcina radialis HA8281-LM2]